MSREQSHDDVCRGSADGHDCVPSLCDECGKAPCQCTWECPDCHKLFDPDLFAKQGACDACADAREETQAKAVA